MRRFRNFLLGPANAREHESSVNLKVDALMNNSVLADPRTIKVRRSPVRLAQMQIRVVRFIQKDGSNRSGFERIGN